MKRLGLIAVLIAAVLFVAQAAFFISTERKIRLSAELHGVYIYEGDLVSDMPPENADKASRTVRATWERCHYWTGLTIKTLLLPVGNCPALTP